MSLGVLSNLSNVNKELSHADVIIVGGGFVGLVTAAAIAKNSTRNVLVLEARPATDPRFRGELIHAHGVRSLKELQLDHVLEREGAARAYGFAVLTNQGDELIELKYPEGYGLAIDHHEMVHALRKEVATLHNVRVMTGVRVHDFIRKNAVICGVVAEDGREFYAPLTAVADGRHSRLRPLTGLAEEAKLLSFTAAVKVKDSSLPLANHGTVMVGAPGPILAYQIKANEIRMCLDVPSDLAKGPRSALAALLKREYAPYVPEPLRADMVKAIDAGQLELCANQSIRTERCVVDGAVLIGDSAGCSHPLSATGMTIGLVDAISLRDALNEHSSGKSLESALLAHEVRRYRYSRAREVLAQALYDVFLGATEGSAALREGMFDYWRTKPRGRQASMALLAGEDSRILSFAREYVTVMFDAVAAINKKVDALPSTQRAEQKKLLRTSAWKTAREPLKRSVQTTITEVLRAFRRRPAATVSAQTPNATSNTRSAHNGEPILPPRTEQRHTSGSSSNGT